MKTNNHENLSSDFDEKVKIKNEILNQTIFSLGIDEHHSIVHFGCGSRNKSFVKYAENKNIEYVGIDIDEKVIEFFTSNCSKNNFFFKEDTMQNFIDDNFETDVSYDWSIIDGLLDKNLYGDNQYEYIDTIIRNLLVVSNIGIIICFNSEQTSLDNYYNSDFITALISTIYNRFTILRINENEYMFCVYKNYF
jgi:hypothetical protein